MELFAGMLPYFIDPRFVLLCFVGAAAGLFVGAIPGLSVSMATALLVSLTYTWETTDALAMIMGVYVVGVFSGAISAILINIPGAPSSVVTTLDGYPLARRGEAYKALLYAAVYSFVGSVFGLLALGLLARPVTALALRFQPMDYFLLSLFGLATVGGLSTGNYAKGLVSALLGVFLALIGLDSVVGTPRLTFGVAPLMAGIPTVPALVGLFGLAEVLSAVADGAADGALGALRREKIPLRTLLKELPRALYYCTIGTLVGALPGAGTPVAAFLAYGEANRIVKKPSRPFGEGAVEGVVASESANNACIGGALIPMLTLAVPGDAVTAIILSVFYVHGLQVPRRILLPLVTALCVIGAYACSNRLFDVGVMFCFGVLGFFLRRRGYGTAPLTLGLVLGGMMDANFRRAVSLASTAENPAAALFLRPITLILLVLTAATIVLNLPGVKRAVSRRRA